MPGSDALWSVHSGEYSGISARPWSTRSAQRRSSRFGSGIATSGFPFVDPDDERARGDDFFRAHAHRLSLGLSGDDQRQLLEVVDARRALEHSGDIGRVHIATE